MGKKINAEQTKRGSAVAWSALYLYTYTYIPRASKFKSLKICLARFVHIFRFYIYFFFLVTVTSKTVEVWNIRMIYIYIEDMYIWKYYIHYQVNLLFLVPSLLGFAFTLLVLFVVLVVFDFSISFSRICIRYSQCRGMYNIENPIKVASFIFVYRRLKIPNIQFCNYNCYFKNVFFSDIIKHFPSG